eukprot:1204508-Prymnesium_polylepis.1
MRELQSELARPDGTKLRPETQALVEQLCGGCPNGYAWFKRGDGFRCGGGGHALNPASLEVEATYRPSPYIAPQTTPHRPEATKTVAQYVPIHNAAVPTLQLSAPSERRQSAARADDYD